MKHLYLLQIKVWDAATYIGWRDRDESSDPKWVDNYLFASLEKAESFALKIDSDDDIYNQGAIYHGEVADDKILELTDCESMEEFEELMEESICDSTFDELFAYIERESNSSVIEEVECANYDYDQSIEGDIIVEWEWVRYPGYARKCLAVRRARSGETATLLTEKDSTSVSQASVILTAKQADDCENLAEAVLDELDDERWKWTNKSAMHAMVDQLCPQY